MAWIDYASRQSHRAATIFRGTFSETSAAFTVATQEIPTATSMVSGIILSCGSIVRGLPETIGGEPLRVATTLTLDNSSGALNAYLVGTTGGTTTEYTSDSFLNLSGKLYAAVYDEDAGAWLEQAITPTLYVSGTIEVGATSVTLPLSSRDDSTLGLITDLVTVENLKNSVAGAYGNGTRYRRDGTTSAYTQAEFNEYRKHWVQNLGETAPYVYGRSAIPLLEVSTEDGSNADEYLSCIAFVSKNEPDITNVDDGATTPWQFFVNEIGEYGRLGVGYNVEAFKIKRDVETDAGTTVALWIVYVVIGPSASYAPASISGSTPGYGGAGSIESLRGQQIYLVPARGDRGSASSSRGICPSEVFRSIVEDHSNLGASAIDTTTFGAAAVFPRTVGLVGGLIRAPVTIAEIAPYVLGSVGLSIYVGNDDKLRIASVGGFPSADRTAAAGTLPELTAHDVLGGWTEIVPADEGQRGAAANRIAVEWNADQEEAWPGSSLPRRVPGATTLPLGGVREASIPGDWLYPPGVELAGDAARTCRAFVTRRYSFVAPYYVGAYYDPGQLFRLTYPLALGTAGAVGITRRLVRLEAVELMPGEQGCRVTVEDCDAALNVQSCLLDAVSNWVRHDPAGTGISLTLTNGDQTVTASGGTPFAGAQVGDTLQTFGAANATNRRSRKITAVTSNVEVEVEYAYGATETLAASAGATPIVDTAWCVLKTHTSADTGASFRSNYLRCCIQATRLFTNNDDGYQVAT